MIKLVTFTDHRMTISAQKCVESAMKHGADKYSIWTPGDLPKFFKAVMSDVIDHDRGCGYWCWKPAILCIEASRLNDGDYLIYADAGTEFVNNMKYIIDRMDQDVFLFTNNFQNKEWCKMDVMIGIVGEVREDKQVQASNIFFKITPFTRRFIKEWLVYCMLPGWVDDSPSKLPNVQAFADNRHDQSILSCLQQKYGLKMHWFPTLTAAHLRSYNPEDTYPAILNHHRKRDSEW